MNVSRNILTACAALALTFASAAATAGSAPIWNGVYVGAHIGGAFGSDEFSDPTDALSLDTGGVVGGIHAGYNLNAGSVILGIEGDFSWSSADGSKTFSDGVDTFTITSSVNYLGSIRGRIGMPVQNMLFYATAGVAWTELELTLKDVWVGGGVTASDTRSMVGYVVGGGVEAKFSQNLSGRIEGLYYGFDDNVAILNSDTKLNISRDTTVVRAGLSYHLN